MMLSDLAGIFLLIWGVLRQAQHKCFDRLSTSASTGSASTSSASTSSATATVLRQAQHGALRQAQRVASDNLRMYDKHLK
jgi:exo-beta-1,3-glucanase (GH17 family)